MLELILIPLVFITSLILIFKNWRIGFVVLLVLSVFMHKELFSIYRWDVLPVRLFMLAFMTYSGLLFVFWLFDINIFGIKYKSLLNLDTSGVNIKEYNILKGSRNTLKVKLFSLFKPTSLQYKKLRQYLAEPFLVLLGLVWLTRAFSLHKSQNITASIFLFGFFTTVVFLGFTLYAYLNKKPLETLKFIKIYIVLGFLTSLFGYFQFYLYRTNEVIIGALWNIPGRLPRVGSTFWDVNHFGGFIALLLPVIGALILVSKKWRDKIIYIVMFAPIFGILLLTSSRSAWIIPFVAFLTFLTVLFVRRFGFKGIGIIVTGIALIAIPLLIEYSDRSSPFRAYVRQYFNYRIDSFDSHFLLLGGSLQIFEKFPVTGGGYGSFFEHFEDTEISTEYFQRDPAGLNTRVPPHTIWGEVLSETGIVGMFVFIPFIALILGTLLYASMTLSDWRDYVLTASMFGSLTGIFTAGIFYSYNSEFFWIILFLYFLYVVGILGPAYNINKISRYFFKSEKLGVALLVLVSTALIFIGLWTNRFIPWDEAIYAKVAKNMIETGNYLVPNWQPTQIFTQDQLASMSIHPEYGNPWFEKPPLYFWMAAFFMNLMGATEFAARLPSAIFGLLTVLVTYKFGKKLFNKTVGYIGSIALITSWQFLYYSRLSMLDVTVGFFITAALLAYTYYRNAFKDSAYFKSKKRLYSVLFLILSGAFIGLAIMTKGVIGFLPLAIIGLFELYLLFSRQIKLSTKLILDYLILAFSIVVVALPWHLAMFTIFGQQFIDVYFLYHVVERASSNIEDKGKPVFWYFTVLKVSMRVWFIALLTALPFSIFRGIQKRNNSHIFVSIWFLFIFAFFSASTSKLVWYIIPIYPVAALIVARFIERVYHFAIQKLPKLNNKLLKGLFIYTLTLGALFYLFSIKHLPYVPNLTRQKAAVLIQKERIFGSKATIYADNIELPLVLYYTDGPYVLTDFTPLKNKINDQKYDEEIIFATKESRLRTLKKDFDHLQLEFTNERWDWVLGSAPSQYNKDLDALELIDEKINSLQEEINEYREDRGFTDAEIPQELFLELQAAQVEKQALEQEISLKLQKT